VKTSIDIVNPKAARQYVVKVLSQRNIRTWFQQKKLQKCPLPGLLPVIEQCLLFSTVYSWKLEQTEIEHKEIETITEAIMSDVSDILLFVSRTVPNFIHDFFEVYEPPSASSFKREFEQLHRLCDSMSALSKTLEELKPACAEVIQPDDHWFHFVSQARLQDKDKQTNVIDFFTQFTGEFHPQAILDVADRLPEFHSIAKVTPPHAHEHLMHEATDGTFKKFWKDLRQNMHDELEISKLNKDHVSKTGLVEVASAFLQSAVLPAQQQLSHGINFVVRAASLIVGVTDLCASIVDNTLRIVKFIFFGRDFGLSLISDALREFGRQTRQQGFRQVTDTFFMMGAILGNERTRLNFPVRVPPSHIQHIHDCPTPFHFSHTSPFQKHLPAPVYGLLHVLEHWEALPHDHESETFISDCLTVLSLFMYLAPCFTDDERGHMIQKYEHGMHAVILKQQHVGDLSFEKDSKSMIMRMQHIQASNGIFEKSQF